MSTPWASSPDLAVEGSARAVHRLRAERWRAITSPPVVFPWQGAHPDTCFFPEVSPPPHDDARSVPVRARGPAGPRALVLPDQQVQHPSGPATVRDGSK
jgi:hypothetical protein